MALQEEFETQGNWLFRHRSYLPIILLVAGLISYITTIRFSNIFSYITPYFWRSYEYFCLLVSLSGYFIRIYTVGYTPTGTSGRNTEKQVAEDLNKTGIYSMVRHPLYLGNFLMYLGISFLTYNPGFIIISILILWLYYERIMYAEECFLRQKFGTDYLTWANATPTFVPRLSLYQSPLLSYSWKKVIKKEKNGIFALFLIFSIFDIIGAKLTKINSVNMVLLTATIITGCAYFILKLIKKRSHVLDEEGR